MDNDRPPAESVLVGIVTYNPDVQVLSQLLSSLRLQSCRVYVFDNGSDNVTDVKALCNNDCNYVTLECWPDNIGLSKAANRIINQAKASEAQFVLLFDQDSIPNLNYIEALVKEYQAIIDCTRLPIAAIQGVQRCKFTNRRDPFVQFGRILPKKVYLEKLDQVIHADFLITSGCLFPISALLQIGEFDEALFIDNIDVEWCSRARSMGYYLVGCGATEFLHAIGDDVVSFGGKVVTRIHSPMRTYYSVRNMCALLRRDYVSRAWKINAVFRALLKFSALFVFSKRRIEYAKQLIRGIKSSIEVSKKPKAACRTH